MFRSTLYFFKDRRIRAEVPDNEQPSGTTRITINEDGVEGQRTMTNISSTRTASTSRQTEEMYQESTPDVDPVIQCVEVNLSSERQGRVEADDCKQEELKAIENTDDGIKVSTKLVEGTASSSYSQDANVDESNSTVKEPNLGVQEKSPQLHDISVTIHVSPSQHTVPEPSKNQERTFPRSVSTMSTDSFAECCRICQQTSDEPLIELGCHCRGELAKAHRKCIQQWFNNKGTNKCEVCRHTATNLQAPLAQPLHNFWAWRHSSRYQAFPRWQGRGRFHPLLAALLILVAGLLFDVLISYYLGASALPVNIIIGVLVVLGLGTAARLIVECCQERRVRRNIQRMEAAADRDHLRQLQNQQ